LSGMVGFLVTRAKVIHQGMSLRDWTHRIPYGALLAVKEAKEAGIERFSIHYPTTTAERSRWLAARDPVITGYSPKGNRVEVFSWDDGKFYEYDG